MAVPIDILDKYKEVTLVVDIFYAQGQPFLVTLSRHIKFNTIQDLLDMKTETLV